MRLPNILLIGAMKSGTTSLYMDLVKHFDVFLAESKETRALCSDEVLTAEGRQRYASLYADARAGQLVCDASTAYSKRPDFEGVAERAEKVLPADFKVIYIVRHPVERIMSQHHHEFSAGLVGTDIDAAVRENPRYVFYSRYAYQLEPWINRFGSERVCVVKFEDYVADHVNVLRKLRAFLGLPGDAVIGDAATVLNSSSNKPVRNRFWDMVHHSAFYRMTVRRLIPVTLRLRLMQWALPKAAARPVDSVPKCLSWLYGELSDDVQKLQEMLSLEAPLWADFGPAPAGRPSVPIEAT